LVVCVLLLALFPAATGSFSAVHGPVTAMRASRAAQIIHCGIASCAYALMGGPQCLYTDSATAEASLWNDPARDFESTTLRC
jgi:hypothetical protein